MKIKQRDYLYFYDSIVKEYYEIREKETGEFFFVMSQVDEYDRKNDYSCVTTGPSFNSGNFHHEYSQIPEDEVLSLKDLEFGDFIDKHYKDDFISHCKSTNSFDYEYFKRLSKKIALYLYNLWVMDSNSKNK